ncbi:uncharacterized protein ACB058_005897 isoform 1-T2 [Synchiropus picturatus]
MLRAISRLLFGEEEKAEDVQTAEAVDEGWLVVSHPEQGNEQLIAHPNISELHVQESVKLDSGTSEPAVTLQKSSPGNIRAMSSIVSQPRYLPEAAQPTCVHKSQSWAEHHLASRHAIHRYNRARLGAPRQTFHLQQPAQRHLSH